MTPNEAVQLIEESLDGDASWTICKITNERHASRPFGVGFGVTLCRGEKVVWEKGGTLESAVKRALARKQELTGV